MPTSTLLLIVPFSNHYCGPCCRVIGDKILALLEESFTCGILLLIFDGFYLLDALPIVTPSFLLFSRLRMLTLMPIVPRKTTSYAELQESMAYLCQKRQTRNEDVMHIGILVLIVIKCLELWHNIVVEDLVVCS
jgi:hypothetical protein